MSKSFIITKTPITDSAIIQTELSNLQQLVERRNVQSYQGGELVNYLMSISSPIQYPSVFFANVAIQPYFGFNWSNDMYKPYNPSAPDQFERKPITMSPIKSDDYYNPRQSKGKIVSKFNVSFTREVPFQSYPLQKFDMSIRSIRIVSDETFPPNISVQWERILRHAEQPDMLKMFDCILDTFGDGYADYLPCGPIRIPAIGASPIAFDRWCIDEIEVESLEFTYDVVYS